jgi:hypothetical protein
LNTIEDILIGDRFSEQGHYVRCEQDENESRSERMIRFIIRLQQKSGQYKQRIMEQVRKLMISSEDLKKMIVASELFISSARSILSSHLSPNPLIDLILLHL